MAASLRESGNLWYAKGDYDRAIADYDQALRLDPSHEALRNLREQASAAKLTLREIAR